ncbi:MAG: hypothetical protein QXJ51_05930 [Sulfolobales archaeon]
MKNMKKKNLEDDPGDIIEIYGEYVSLKELGIATLISSIGAFSLYYLTPAISSLLNMQNIAPALRVTLGALGATIGFIISIQLTRVKRIISEET